MNHVLFFSLTLLLVVGLVGCAPTPTPEPTPTPVPPTPTPDLAPGEILWTFDTQAPIWSSPVIHENRIFFGSDNGQFYALDRLTHQPAWTFTTGGKIRSHPTIAAGKIYFTSDDGYLYAVEMETGAEIWKLDIATSAKPRAERLSSGWDYAQSSPVIADDILYVGSADFNLYAVDPSSGQIKWQFATQQVIRATPAVSGNVVYITSYDGNAYAIDKTTGQEIWNFSLKGMTPASPTVDNGLVYAGSRSTYFYAIDAVSGKEVWQAKFGSSWVESSAIVNEGSLYIGSSDLGALLAFDSQTGAEKWRFLTSAYSWGKPVYANGVVYIGSAMYKGNLFAVDANSGQELWRVPVETKLPDNEITGVFASPAVVDDTVYFGALDGLFYAVNAE